MYDVSFSSWFRAQTPREEVEDAQTKGKDRVWKMASVRMPGCTTKSSTSENSGLKLKLRPRTHMFRNQQTAPDGAGRNVVMDC